ncbi:MAG: TraR/DksA family transcriptional regulator [Thermodesulfovibrionales bacterium]
MAGSKKIKKQPQNTAKVKAVPLSKKTAVKSASEKKTAKPVVKKSSATKKKEVKKGIPAPSKVMKKEIKKDIQKEEPKPERLRELKNALLKRRDAIVKEAKDEIAKYISGENRQLVDTAVDDGDWAVVDISEDINLMRLDAHRKLMLDIDEALRKIQEGTYGTCEDCGEEISEKRLGVMPTATLCISCKENKEQLEAIARQDVE